MSQILFHIFLFQSAEKSRCFLNCRDFDVKIIIKTLDSRFFNRKGRFTKFAKGYHETFGFWRAGFQKIVFA